MCFFYYSQNKKLSSTINLSALIWSIKAALKSEISWEAKSVNVGSVIYFTHECWYFSFMIKNHVESTDKSFSQNAQRCSVHELFVEIFLGSIQFYSGTLASAASVEPERLRWPSAEQHYWDVIQTELCELEWTWTKQNASVDVLLILRIIKAVSSYI